MCQLVTTLQIFQQQGRSSKGSDQFFFTSAQSPAMRTIQQHARGSARQALNTSHSWHQCSTMHGGLFSAFNPPPPPPLPPITRPSLISIGQSCPLYFSRKLQMFCNLHNCTQGKSTPLPSKTRGACTKLSRNIAMQMCQKVQRAILDHFMTVTLDKWNPAGRVACMGKG